MRHGTFGMSPDTHGDWYQEKIDQGCIVVSVEQLPGGHVRHWMVDPATDCCRPMRCNTYCAMPKDHRGRCSSIIFGCDGCGQARRGQPAFSNEEVTMCFLCYVVPQMPKHRRRRRLV